MDEIPIQTWACYADESSIVQDRYTVVSGTVVRSDRLKFVLNGIDRLRKKHQMFAELKWSKVSNQKVEAYTEFVDFFFDMAAKGYLAFRATTFDNHKWDHRKYNENDPDIGLSKLYYQMLLHQIVGQYGDLASLYVCLDRRRSSTSLNDLQRILNAGAAKEYGLDFGPVRVLVSRDSKKSDMIQLNDIILGAVAAYKNQKHRNNGTRAAKRDLAIHVSQQSSTLQRYSSVGQTAFSIWNFRAR